MNEKLIINTNLLRKEPEFKTYTCMVEKAVPVPTEEFERLKHAPMCNNHLISENLNSMWYGNGVHHCLLIYDKQQGDGLLIESEGAPYVRYAQYIPNAKLLYENHMQTHLQKMKFYCPLEISRWDDDEYNEISPDEAAAYESEINHFISDLDLPEEKERGLMHWYNRGNSVDQKVFSAFMSVEEQDGELVGVITSSVYGQLTEDELEDLREYCIGQLSDGAGESLEQRPIKTSDGEIYVSFWSFDDSWSLQTTEEMDRTHSKELTEESETEMTL